MIALTSRTPLARGAEKLIFAHPDAPGLLIKVWRQDGKWRAGRRRLGRYASMAKEVVEHLAAREQGADTRYIQNVVGLVDTDMGVGLVVEAVRQPDGTLAKSLQQIVADRELDDVKKTALLDIVRWIGNSDLILRDLSRNNLVWSEDGQCFVIIDGLGSRPRPSLRNISRWYNRRSNRRRAAKILARFRGRLDR